MNPLLAEKEGFDPQTSSRVDSQILVCCIVYSFYGEAVCGQTIRPQADISLFLKGGTEKLRF